MSSCASQRPRYKRTDGTGLLPLSKILNSPWWQETSSSVRETGVHSSVRCTAAAEDVSKCYASPKGFPRPLPGDQGRGSQVQSWWITNTEMGRTEKRSLGEFTSEESGWTSDVCWEALPPTSKKVTRDPWMSGFSLSKMGNTRLKKLRSSEKTVKP